jgi:hypothetical protein
MAPAHNDWRGIVKKGKKPQHGFGTLGYCAVTQAPNGIIHLMTSKGRPSMHFAMNEAWILSDYTGEVNELPGKPDASKLKTITEKYPDGQVRITSSGWIGKTGFVLHGTENWFYENGKKQYEATFNNGALQGMETYRNCDGSIKWTRDHTPYGTTVYTTYWPNGKKKTQSTWWGLMAHGPAASWDKNGKLLHEVLFENGKIVNQPSQTGQAAD